MSKHTELITEARSYADAEMSLHDASAVVGEKVEETHASNASLFGALADALEAAEAAKKELIDAIRWTVEYVGNDTLPAINGWSWFDALREHAPEDAQVFVDNPIHRLAAESPTSQMHTEEGRASVLALAEHIEAHHPTAEPDIAKAALATIKTLEAGSPTTVEWGVEERMIEDGDWVRVVGGHYRMGKGVGFTEAEARTESERRVNGIDPASWKRLVSRRTFIGPWEVVAS